MNNWRPSVEKRCGVAEHVVAMPLLLFFTETVNYFEQEQQRTVQHAPVRKILRETVGLCERVQRHPNERFVDFPVPQLLEELALRKERASWKRKTPVTLIDVFTKKGLMTEASAHRQQQGWHKTTNWAALTVHALPRQHCRARTKLDRWMQLRVMRIGRCLRSFPRLAWWCGH